MGAETMEHPRPLKVLVVGAGIGGLTAAIALRKQGHEVTLIEKSRFAQELGAAIHVAPNCHGVLRKLGIFPDEFGSTETEYFVEYDTKGELLVRLPNVKHLWSHKWLLAHRVRLHNALKVAATSTDGPGIPAKLLLSSQVKEVDCETATVVTTDGTELKGDLVVGADGVHSITRRSIPNAPPKPFDSGKSCFRFIVPRSAVTGDPVTANFVQCSGQLTVFSAVDRKIVMYPTNDNKELNVGAIHPSKETHASASDWNGETSVELMLTAFRDFDPAIKAILRKADPATLKLWNLLDMEKLPSFVHHRLALIGDAAHPFLPHQGQGGAMAIEDAAALAVVLPLGTRPEEIPARLQLYNSIRYDRAHTIQQYTRLSGHDKGDGGEQLDIRKYMAYNFGHDEWDHSSQRLREFLWSRVKVRGRQPTAFGPMPGPTHDHYGNARTSNPSPFTTASIKFRTSRTMLQNLFPPGVAGFDFTRPGTNAYASFSQTTKHSVDWLGGSSYSNIGLYIHDVQYSTKDGKTRRGVYLPILFENLADPILSGREEMGLPKVYSSIEVHRHNSSYFIKAGWQGAEWATFKLESLSETSSALTDQHPNGEGKREDLLTYRSLPRLDGRDIGFTCDGHVVSLPFKDEMLAPQPLRSWTAKRASFQLKALGWDVLPTLNHIVSRLAELPVYEVVSAEVVEGVGRCDVCLTEENS